MKRRINKKGFTIVELLAVVVIIGVIGTIAIVGVNSVIKRSHEKYNLAQAKLFVAAAQTYFSDHKSRLPVRTFTQTTVTLNELIEENYIDQIVDYKKEPYDVYKSYASATKMGAGQYAYDGELITKDGERAKYKEHKNDNGSIIFKNEGSTFTSELYTNNEKEIEIVMSDSDTIAGYIVSIYKNNKKVEDLEYKEIGNSTSASTKVKLSKNIYKDGKYKIRVKLIDIYNNQKTADSNYITLDTIAPECSITLDGQKGNKIDNDNYWYKAGKNLKIILKVKESNKFKYKLSPDLYNYQDHSGNTALTEIISVIQSTSTSGKVFKATVKDLAGNTCQKEKKVFYDKDAPICTLKRQGGYWPGPEEAGWFWQNPAVSYSISDTGNVSGINMNNSYIMEETSKINITNSSGTINQTHSSATANGTNYKCHAEDQAGNVGESTLNFKVDITIPSVESIEYPSNGVCVRSKNDAGKIYTCNYASDDKRQMTIHYNVGPVGIAYLKKYECDSSCQNCNYFGSAGPGDQTKYTTGAYHANQKRYITYTVVDNLYRESPINTNTCQDVDIYNGGKNIRVNATIGNGTGNITGSGVALGCSVVDNPDATLTLKYQFCNESKDECTIPKERKGVHGTGAIFGMENGKNKISITCTYIDAYNIVYKESAEKVYYCYATSNGNNCLIEDNCKNCSSICHDAFAKEENWSKFKMSKNCDMCYFGSTPEIRAKACKKE